MKMKTLTLNGQPFRVYDDGAVRCDEAQKLTEEQQAQARKNIGAMKNGGIESDLEMKGNAINNAGTLSFSCLSEKPGYIDIVPSADVESGRFDLQFIGSAVGTIRGRVRLTNIADGNSAYDAATVGQLNAALADHAVYKNLYGRVEITAEDIAAAGDEGVVCLTIGSDDVDLAKYDDLLIRLWVPKDEALNAENGLLRIHATKDSTNSAGSENQLLITQSLGISTVCGVTTARDNAFAIKTQWCGDTFLYGEVLKNGYSGSLGYAGTQNGWTLISNNFKKSQKRYLHILAYNTSTGRNKFPAGTYAEVYGR